MTWHDGVTTALCFSCTSYILAFLHPRHFTASLSTEFCCEMHLLVVLSRLTGSSARWTSTESQICVCVCVCVCVWVRACSWWSASRCPRCTWPRRSGHRQRTLRWTSELQTSTRTRRSMTWDDEVIYCGYEDSRDCRHRYTLLTDRLSLLVASPCWAARVPCRRRCSCAVHLHYGTAVIHDTSVD